MMQLEIYGKPIPWSAPRRSKGHFYSTHTKRKEEVRWQLKGQFNGEPWKGPIKLDVIFFFEPPKSTSKVRRFEMINGSLHHIVKPDRSNCLKFIEDACTGIIWEDDRQVVEGSSKKMYGTVAKTVLTVSHVGLLRCQRN